MKITEA